MRNQSIFTLDTFRKTFRSFNFNIWIIFALALFNVLYKIRITSNGIESANNLWNPIWLLLGPFVYFAFVALIKKEKRIKFLILHLFPFFIYTLFYGVNLLKVDFLHPWGNSLYVWYQNSFWIKRKSWGGIKHIFLII